MKILSFTAMGTIIPYSLRDVHAGLCRLGHDVYVQDLASIATGKTGPGPDVHIAINDALAWLRPDAVVTLDKVGLLPHYYAVSAEPPLVVSWFFDAPMPFLDNPTGDLRWMNSRYHLYSWDRAYVDEVREYGIGRVHYLPFATNPEIYRPTPEPGFDYDVSFVGGSSPHRRELLHDLAERGIVVDVFGDDGWREIRHPNLRFHGRADNRRECPRIYARSRINLNITNTQLLTSLPVRVFDVLASGGFLLTDYREDADRLFVPDKELVVWQDAGDLAHKIRHYLDAPEERDAIAAGGRERVLADYTFEQALGDMLDTAAGEQGNGTVDSPMPGPVIFGALWMNGLSCLKFGRYREAAERLLTALNMKSSDPKLLLALALLAARTGQDVSVAQCADALAAQRSPLASWAQRLRRHVGDPAAHVPWEELYGEDMPNLELEADGTVRNWRPTPAA